MSSIFSPFPEPVYSWCNLCNSLLYFVFFAWTCVPLSYLHCNIEVHVGALNKHNWDGNIFCYDCIYSFPFSKLFLWSLFSLLSFFLTYFQIVLIFLPRLKDTNVVFGIKVCFMAISILFFSDRQSHDFVKQMFVYNSIYSFHINRIFYVLKYM